MTGDLERPIFILVGFPAHHAFSEEISNHRESRVGVPSAPKLAQDGTNSKFKIQNSDDR